MYRFAFLLCRCLGVEHPDYLFERLTARQLWEWWLLWNDEPWGDGRDDLRAWAQACIASGAKGVELSWPYVQPEWTVAEIQAEMNRLEAASNKHGDRR